MNCIFTGTSDHEIERVAGVNRGAAPMTGTAVGNELPRAVPSGGMGRVIQRTWLQRNRDWVTLTLLAVTCTIALLSASNDAPQVPKINEGRIVVSTVKQGQIDDFIPLGARATLCYA